MTPSGFLKAMNETKSMYFMGWAETHISWYETKTVSKTTIFQIGGKQVAHLHLGRDNNIVSLTVLPKLAGRFHDRMTTLARENGIGVIEA